MKLLFDENLAPGLVAEFCDLCPGSAHVRDVGLARASDAEVWREARERGLAIVSKDADFQAMSLVHGHPPKVVWLRVGNVSTAQIAHLLRSRWSDVLAFDRDVAASFLALG